MKFCYPAVLKKHEDGSYEVHFPDLCGCEGHGKDLESALDDAREAELAWLSVEILEDMNQPPYVSDPAEIVTGENETVRLLAVNLRFTEGWDE